MDNLNNIISNIIDGMSGGFCNVSCQRGVKIQCKSNVNFWLDESKDITLESAREYVKKFNASNSSHYLEVDTDTDGDLVFSFTFDLESGDE